MLFLLYSFLLLFMKERKHAIRNLRKTNTRETYENSCEIERLSSLLREWGKTHEMKKVMKIDKKLTEYWERSTPGLVCYTYKSTPNEESYGNRSETQGLLRKSRRNTLSNERKHKGNDEMRKVRKINNKKQGMLYYMKGEKKPTDTRL